MIIIDQNYTLKFLFYVTIDWIIFAERRPSKYFTIK